MAATGPPQNSECRHQPPPRDKNHPIEFCSRAIRRNDSHTTRYRRRRWRRLTVVTGSDGGSDKMLS